MLFKKALLPMVILASLTGCGPASLDGTSLDNLDKSIGKVASKLPDAQRPQFGEDITLIKAYYEKEKPDQLLTNLNGKSAAEITAEASNLREQQRLEQEKLAVEEQQRAYLVELTTKKEALIEAIKPLQESKKQSLERLEFKVESAKISLAKTEKTGEAVNSIELTIKNGTTEEVYSAFFDGSLVMPAAEGKPILVANFDVSFEIPLQPGETRTVMFVPTLVSDWRTVILPEGAVFTATPDDLMNIANKPLFSLGQFSPEDQESLDKLLSDLAAINGELGVAEGGDTVTPEGAAAVHEDPVDTAQPAVLLPEREADIGLDQPVDSAVPVPATLAPAPAADIPEQDQTPALEQSEDPVASDPETEAPATTVEPALSAEGTDLPSKVDGSTDVTTEAPAIKEVPEPRIRAPEAEKPAPETSESDGTLPPVGKPEVDVTPLKTS